MLTDQCVVRTLLKFLAIIVPLSGLPATAMAQAVQPQAEGIGDVHSQAAAVASVTAPQAALERPTLWGEPTEVRTGIYVIDVDGVDSANQNFSASVYYEARWNNPLLRHDGPAPKIVPTTAVWTPRLTIVNQQQVWNAFPSFVEIAPDGEVVYRQKTWGWFSQPLDLHDFPLDRQTLSIQIVAAGLLQSDVTLTPLVRPEGRMSGIADKFSLPDFDVVSHNAEPRAYFPFKQDAGTAGFMMEIDIQRIHLYYLWKMIVPLCLIVAMSWVPRWIKPEEIGTNMGISATAFLTLVAYLFSTAVLLPRANYFTRMDQFILLSTLMVFLGLVQTVAASNLQSQSIARWVRPVNLWSRALYPIALLGTLGASFLL